MLLLRKSNEIVKLYISLQLSFTEWIQVWSQECIKTPSSLYFQSHETKTWTHIFPYKLSLKDSINVTLWLAKVSTKQLPRLSFVLGGRWPWPLIQMKWEQSLSRKLQNNVSFSGWLLMPYLKLMYLEVLYYCQIVLVLFDTRCEEWGCQRFFLLHKVWWSVVGGRDRGVKSPVCHQPNLYKGSLPF